MKNDYFLGLSEEGFHRVAYREWGEQNRTQPPIVCVHGLTRNARDFDALAGFLANHGSHVFCPDIVGRGDSDWLKNPLHYTYEQYIADMNIMIARTQSHQIDWIGTSMGGLIGMFLASMDQSPIRRLVLNDIGAQIPAKAIARLSAYSTRDPEFASIDDAKKYYQTMYGEFGNLTDAQWQHFAESSVREVSPGKWIAKMDHGVKMVNAKSKIAWRSLLHPLRALEGIWFDIDLWHIWRRVKCPVLIIHGKKSDILLPSIIEKMRAIHPQTEMIAVDDAGHAPALLDPAQHEVIYRWLRQVS